MKLNTALKAYGHKIIDGDSFLWDCWSNSHSIDIIDNDVKIYITYDLDTTKVHHIVVDLANTNNLFKWYLPSSLASYKKEAIARKCKIEENDLDSSNITEYDKSIFVSSNEILDLVALKLLS